MNFALEQARNPNTDPYILDVLSNNTYWAARVGVAINPNTPPETLERLSYDEYWDVRCVVIKNPNTPQYIKDLNKFKNYLRFY